MCKQPRSADMSTHDLDDMGKAILEAIYQHGGEADTSEIKEYTGFEDNSKLHYRRKEHLEPNGFIETTTEDRGDTLSVTVWGLTEMGKNAVDRVMTETDEPPLAERVDELREIVGEMRRDVQAFEGRVDAVEQSEQDVSHIESDVTEMYEQITEFEDRITEVEARMKQVEGSLESMRSYVLDVDNAIEALVSVGLLEKKPAEHAEPEEVLGGQQAAYNSYSQGEALSDLDDLLAEYYDDGGAL